MTLTTDGLRRFRQVERGLRVTDPDWFARHCSGRRQYGGLVRCSVVVMSVTLVIVGTLTELMLLVFCGILLATGVLTNYVSFRSRRRGR